MGDEASFNYLREIQNKILNSTSQEGTSTPEDYFKKQLRDTLESLKAIENQEVIVFIGGDKSGKSTLINTLLGNPLTVKGVSSRHGVEIVTEANYDGPLITGKAQFDIRGPTFWTSNKIPGKKILVEFPGFGKYSSVQQEKFNHLIAPSLYGSIKKAKIVLLWNVHDILTKKFSEIIEQIKFLESLFEKGLVPMIPAISIVFTHVPDVYYTRPVNMDIIIGLITEYVTKSKQLTSLTVKKFLSDIISKAARHGVLKKPTATGPFTGRINVNVRQSLLNDCFLTADELARFLFNIMPLDASIYSPELAETVGSQTFARLVAATAQIVRGTSPADGAKTEEELNTQKQRLVNYRQLIRKGLQPGIPIDEKIEVLEAVDPVVEKIIQDGRLRNRLEHIKEVKQSIRIPMKRLSVMDKAMNHLLTKMYLDADMLIQNVDLKLQIIKEVAVANQLKKENEKLEKETIRLTSKINMMRRDQQRRRTFVSRLFRRDHVAAKIVNLLRGCTRPVLRRILSMSGIQYVASGVRSSVLVLSDIIERERITHY